MGRGGLCRAYQMGSSVGISCAMMTGEYRVGAAAGDGSGLDPGDLLFRPILSGGRGLTWILPGWLLWRDYRKAALLRA